jgi:hypothetical protein
MKNFGLFFLINAAFVSALFAQDRPQRGPYNTLPGGVVDGVAIQDEVPVRAKVEYEYVRANDVAWQKRVFSRIDSRELMNHPIFFPTDSYSDNYDPLNPKSSSATGATASPSGDENWLRNSSRLSLWTIIRQHVLAGDLTVYRPSSPFYPDVEDGYSFKYPIEKADYFSNLAFRIEINPFLSLTGDDTPIIFPVDDGFGGAISTTMTKTPGMQLADYVKQAGYDVILSRYNDSPASLQALWDKTQDGQDVLEPGRSKWIASNSIIAYYIKEDWYFDKERSILDKRIIAIAPVINFKYDASGARNLPIIYNEKNEPLTKITTVDSQGNKVVEFKTYTGQMEERELFWLYFDELRNVIVNYYVYNDQNDAQWMSFDDLFWKRKFSSTIYRVSDKFDREIEDYKFGVDALYESEKVKETIRDWEHDLWHF